METSINTSPEVIEPPPTGPAGTPRTHGRLDPVYAAVAGVATGTVVAFLILIAAPFIRDSGYYHSVRRQPVLQGTTIGPLVSKHLARTNRRIASLRKKSEGLVPSRPCLIICTSQNTFVLLHGLDTLRKGVCSTGSYTLLKAFDNSQEWIFQTPRGMFRVQQKIVEPVWRMPDWAFIEEGRPVPAINAPERYEEGVLGDYALSLGDGYLLHGTLYQRLLGMPVTHGCVRIGDDDLKAIYEALDEGSMVFIY